MNFQLLVNRIRQEQPSNLWWIPNSICIGFGPFMKTAHPDNSNGIHHRWESCAIVSYLSLVATCGGWDVVAEANVRDDDVAMWRAGKMTLAKRESESSFISVESEVRWGTTCRTIARHPTRPPSRLGVSRLLFRCPKSKWKAIKVSLLAGWFFLHFLNKL